MTVRRLASTLCAVGAVVVLCTGATAAPAWAQSQTQNAAQSWPLRAARFTGLQRYQHDDIVRLSGLVAGRTVTVDQLNSIAQQLTNSGLFAAIRYRYTHGADGLDAEFQVTESTWTVPVAFDNFLSISDDELIRGVAEHVPAFDGTAVEDGRANDFIAAALQRVLVARGERGRVVAQPRADLASGRTVMAFMVRDSGANLTLCAVRVPDAPGARERDLIGLARPFIGNPYSRTSLELLANGSLRDYYLERGYWGITFERPSGTLAGECSGVTASIPVSEGPAYRWAGARWSGVARLTPEELERALDMRRGAVADARKIEAGLAAVKAVYDKQGFVQQTHTMSPELDAATQQAFFSIVVSEGQQYRMGTFTYEGLSASDGDDLTRRWRLAAGEVFDGSYVRTFMTREQARIQRPGGPLMTSEVSLDTAKGLAHVKLRPMDAESLR